jgi:hypothetical protein
MILNLTAQEASMTSTKTNQKATYTVVVRDHNSWDAKTGIHCLLRDCGHNHKTLAAAANCHAKLTKVTGQWGNGGTTSAQWFHAVVEDSNGERFDYYELEQALVTR